MTPAENSMNAIDSIDEIVDKDHKKHGRGNRVYHSEFVDSAMKRRDFLENVIVIPNSIV